jgi:hypothetical protein
MENGKGYRMISAYLREEIYRKGKETHIRWGYLIEKGIKSVELERNFNELLNEYTKLQEKQRRTAELLGKYAGETNVLG